jgi:hypothetical protein
VSDGSIVEPPQARHPVTQWYYATFTLRSVPPLCPHRRCSRRLFLPLDSGFFYHLAQIKVEGFVGRLHVKHALFLRYAGIGVSSDSARTITVCRERLTLPGIRRTTRVSLLGQRSILPCFPFTKASLSLRDCGLLGWTFARLAAAD